MWWQVVSRRSWRWFAAIIAFGLAGVWFMNRPPRELAVEAYVWQRRDSAALRGALGRAAKLASRYHFLGVELGKDASGWHAKRTQVPDELIAGQGLVLRLGASLAGVDWENNTQALERVMTEAAWMASKPVSELQIDFDCPQRKLFAYQILLGKIKSSFPGRFWTITALPAWLDEPTVAGLFEVADGVVLQVHSLQLPQDPAQPVVLCDPAAARTAVKRMTRFGQPFRVALNTYGCVVLFDNAGRVVDVISEDTGGSPPREATQRVTAISDVDALAGLVREWRQRPPHGMEGIVWYRLPLDTDRRNWRWETWAKVAAGEVPGSVLRLDVRKTDEGAWDVILRNAGERDERLPAFLQTGCSALVLEGMNGYDSDGSQLRMDSIAWPWLPPGAAITAGWLRTRDSSETPRPTILERP